MSEYEYERISHWAERAVSNMISSGTPTGWDVENMDPEEIAEELSRLEPLFDLDEDLWPDLKDKILDYLIGHPTHLGIDIDDFGPDDEWC
jgi:hypothetical protein